MPLLSRPANASGGLCPPDLDPRGPGTASGGPGDKGIRNVDTSIQSRHRLFDRRAYPSDAYRGLMARVTVARRGVALRKVRDRHRVADPAARETGVEPDITGPTERLAGRYRSSRGGDPGSAVGGFYPIPPRADWRE
ncbi:MAG: hypothetical protein QNJ91_12295 [Gammaproteobacteria bacterium]|nr:hypothetical protein [Gammaproteobacteria bacterium]